MLIKRIGMTSIWFSIEATTNAGFWFFDYLMVPFVGCLVSRPLQSQPLPPEHWARRSLELERAIAERETGLAEAQEAA